MLSNEIDMGFTSQEVEIFWSNVAKTYEDTNERFMQSHVQRFDISIPHLKLSPDDRLLNAWSRQGEAVTYIRKFYPLVSLENLEISKEMLRQAGERFPGEEFQWFDLTKIPYPDSYFDAVLSLEMLEHTPQPLGILKEFFRVLKPGGRLVLTCPPAAVGEIYLFILNRFFGNHGEGPHKFLSSLTVKKLLRLSGFDLELHKATMFLPLGNRFLNRINAFSERIFQWFPACDFGDRQLYVALKPD